MSELNTRNQNVAVLKPLEIPAFLQSRPDGEIGYAMTNKGCLDINRQNVKITLTPDELKELQAFLQKVGAGVQ